MITSHLNRLYFRGHLYEKIFPYWVQRKNFLVLTKSIRNKMKLSSNQVSSTFIKDVFFIKNDRVFKEKETYVRHLVK